MGYALAAASAGGWVYLMIGVRWFIHTMWGFFIMLNSGDNIPAR